MLSFDVYRLDAANARLWRGKQIVKLPPKAFGVLHYLAAHPGQLVTKAELFQTIWPETVVTDSALTVCIKELRKALREDPKAPRYIETVHRRGFRFIGQVVSSQHSVVSSSKSEPTPYTLYPTPFLVGREAELAQLHGYLGKALRGERQIVFVSGEPGIGKTTLVDAFLHSLTSGVPSLESEVPTSSTQHRRRGSGGGNALSSTAPGRRTCRCSKP